MSMLLRWAVGACACLSVVADAWAQVGACCLQDTGACIMATQENCEDPLNGVWLGAGATCADDLPCSTTYGACCMPDACRTTPGFVCSLIDEHATFLGEGVACVETTYETTPLPAGAWVPMVGATPLTFADDGSGFGETDEGVATLALPAPFPFEGGVMEQGATLNVHTNGFVSFDLLDVTVRPDTLNFRLEFGPDASTPNGAICPLWSDQVNVVARTRTVIDGGTTTLVIEWDTEPFDAEAWAGRYQLHLVASDNPVLDGTVRFLYRDGALPTPFSSPTSSDDELFIGVHSAGGLSVHRADLDGLRTAVVEQGFAGVALRAIVVEGGCATNACDADFDGDGDVDLTDFGTFGASFNSTPDDANYNPNTDFDGDGDVDLTDFGSFGAEFNRTDCLAR